MHQHLGDVLSVRLRAIFSTILVSFAQQTVTMVSIPLASE